MMHAGSGECTKLESGASIGSDADLTVGAPLDLGSAWGCQQRKDSSPSRFDISVAIWHFRTLHEHQLIASRGPAIFFTFPEDARWNSDRMAVEFGVEIGEYRGVVHIGRRVFQRLLTGTPTPERCLEAYHLQRTQFELIAERKLRRRQLTDDANVEITGRDLRERESRPSVHPSSQVRFAQ